MVALSMADGWARVTGETQAVIVHVDVGTLNLGAALHNSSIGRAPVLIFAGLSPYSEVGHLGSRTEYQMWLQDAPDQKAIVRQYCRYVGEFRTASTVKQTVARALQFAASDPKGPVYLVGAREVMAEKLKPHALGQYVAVGPAALPQEAVDKITEALAHAKSPMVITGYSGRNHACPEQLVELANAVRGLRVLDTGGSDMCFPFSHRASLGLDVNAATPLVGVDVILILDCDVPWIPSRNPPGDHTRIYHVGVDPLNNNMNVSFYPALGRWKADSYTALTQLNAQLKTPALAHLLHNSVHEKRWHRLAEEHAVRLQQFAKLATPFPDGTFDENYIGAVVKSAVPHGTVFVVEAVTCAVNISNQIQAETPGSWINCGGAGLGWSGGAALGVKLAFEEKPKFVCQIVADGTFMFSAPNSVYWIASRYNIPVLTIVLNNSGE